MDRAEGDEMIIDGHSHLGGPDKNDGKGQSSGEILERMDRAGADMAVVFPFNEAEPGVSFARCNDYIAAEARRHPDRLIGFCRLDPNAGRTAVAELERSVRELGLKGVKLHPTAQDFGLDHPALAEIMEAAQGLGIPVLFDTGKKASPPAGVAALAARYPGLVVIMAHMNLYEETLAAARAARNVFIGTTGYFNIRRLGTAIVELGAERFIAGSDSPYIRMESETGKFGRVTSLNEEERRRILGGNIGKVLNLAR